jgi:hypothetical protein
MVARTPASARPVRLPRRGSRIPGRNHEQVCQHENVAVSQDTPDLGERPGGVGEMVTARGAHHHVEDRVGERRTLWRGARLGDAVAARARGASGAQHPLGCIDTNQL